MNNHAPKAKAFAAAAENVGSQVFSFSDIESAMEYVVQHAGDSIMIPPFSSGLRLGLAERLEGQVPKVMTADFRENARSAVSGLTGVNFALADTGTLVLESTDEAIRLATTLPVRHFALLDPEKILPDSLDAVESLRTMHQRETRNYIAYITGPSRTADIERVLTIGVHGPKELHILLVPGLSEDLLEM